MNAVAVVLFTLAAVAALVAAFFFGRASGIRSTSDLWQRKMRP